jgi:hypothetical protein
LADNEFCVGSCDFVDRTCFSGQTDRSTKSHKLNTNQPNAQGVCNAQVDYTIYKPEGSDFSGEYKVKAKVEDLNADTSFEIELNFFLR